MAQIQIQPDYNNLYPGSKFTIKNSNNIYTLVGYTSNRNIVYFDDKNTNYVNNLLVSNNDVIDDVVFIQKSNYQERVFKY
jgi:hypothetical protein